MGATRGSFGWVVVGAVALLAAGCGGGSDPALPAQACGDGVKVASEACDDGNVASGDGCSPSCAVEAGFACAGSPSVCDLAPPAGVVAERCATLPPAGGGTCRVTPGGAGMLLEGTVLLPGRILRGGQVAVDAAGLVTCVGCDCVAGAVGATRVTCPSGVLSPGLVNALDRLAFSQNPPRADGGERYEHRHDWRLGQGGHTAIPAVGGAAAAEQQWTELRQVLAGTTSVVGSGGVAGLLRNLDRAGLREGLAGAPASMDAFPLGDQAGTRLVSGCGYPDIVTPASLAAAPAAFLDAAEGVDASAANELACLSSTAAGGQDLLLPQVALVGAVAAGPAELAQLAVRGTALVWSPRSNLALYGDTARVTVAARAGVQLAMGTDWAISGSSTLLRELACADRWNRERLAGFFSDEQLWRMATRSAADAAGVAGQLGELAVGRQADLAVFAGAVHRDFRAVLDAGPADVALVLRGGRVLHGDAAVVAALEPGGCEPVDVCGVAKRTCLERELGTTWAALAAANASRPPAFACGTPAGEPACTPARPASVDGSTVYDGVITAGDGDGDGIPDALDACPAVFDPVRPLDGGSQADLDGDGVGDACDPCPLVAGSLACQALASFAPGR